MDKDDVKYIDTIIDKEDTRDVYICIYIYIYIYIYTHTHTHTHIHKMEYYSATQRIKFWRLQQHG